LAGEVKKEDGVQRRCRYGAFVHDGDQTEYNFTTNIDAREGIQGVRKIERQREGP
jgi:hypothetical protein